MFDVFVEGPVEPSPGAVRKLAETIAAKYGLSADDFAARLARGRVRVKAKVDRYTADAYVKSLAKIGARCTVEPARGGDASAPINRAATPPVGVPVTRTPASGVPTEPRRATPPIGVRAATPPAGTRTSSPSAGVPVRAQTPPAGVPMTRAQQTQTPGRGVATARPNVPRSATLSDTPLRPPAPYVAARFKTPSSELQRQSSQPMSGLEARPQSQPIASGLAAATTGPIDTNLGALEHSEAGALTLSSLDGHADIAIAPESSGSFGPSVELDTGPYAPAPSTPTAKPSTDKPSNEPLDLFAPIDDGADFKVEVAPEDDFARKQSMPMPKTDAPPPPVRASTPIPTPTAKRSKLGPLADLKVRFAAGVVAAILVGFVPATIVASLRERSTYRALDEQYLKEAETSQDPDLEAKFLDKKRSERRGIALTSLLIWALAGGGVAYVWFRRVPWDRWG